MKYIKLLLIIPFLILVSSCSRYEELDDLSIISNIEIKYKNNKFVVVMQEIIPKQNDNSFKYDYSYRTGSGKSINKAFSSIIDHSPKRIYLKKIQNIVIKKSHKKEIIKELIKYQVDNKNISKNSSVVISNNSLKSIMKINNDYKYIDSVLKDKKVLLKDVLHNNKKNKRIKIPLLNIKNNELILKKYTYLQVYPSLM